MMKEMRVLLQMQKSIIFLCLCSLASGLPAGLCWGTWPCNHLLLQPSLAVQGSSTAVPVLTTEQGGHEETKEMVSSREACHCHLPGAEGLWQLTPIQADTRQEQLLSALGDLVSPVINSQSWNQASSWLNSDVPGSLSLPSKSGWSWSSCLKPPPQGSQQLSGQVSGPVSGTLSPSQGLCLIFPHRWPSSPRLLEWPPWAFTTALSVTIRNTTLGKLQCMPWCVPAQTHGMPGAENIIHSEGNSSGFRNVVCRFWPNELVAD